MTSPELLASDAYRICLKFPYKFCEQYIYIYMKKYYINLIRTWVCRSFHFELQSGNNRRSTDLYLWRFSAYGFQTIERLPIVIFDVSWNAERVSLSQGERKSSEHLDRGTVLRRVIIGRRMSGLFLHELHLYSYYLQWTHYLMSADFPAREALFFHVVHAWRCSITAVSLGISWAAPTVTDGLVAKDPVVYLRLSDLNCPECLLWKHLEKGLFILYKEPTRCNFGSIVD